MSYNRFAAVVVLLVAACSSGPQITRTQEIPESADTPYKKILVTTVGTWHHGGGEHFDDGHEDTDDPGHFHGNG